MLADFHNLTYDFCNYEWLIRDVFIKIMSRGFVNGNLRMY